jgi:general secretion pathway protein C
MNQRMNDGNLRQRLGAALTAWPRVALTVLALAVIVQLARLLWLLITPIGSIGDWQGSFAQPMPAAARMALFAAFDPHGRAAQAADGANETITSLQLTLFGIRQNVGSGLGSAILAGPDGVQQSYRVGEEVMPGVKLAAVRFDHVLLDRYGTRESLYMDQSVPAETVGADPADVAQAAAQPGSADAASGASALTPDNLRNAVGFAPRQANGRINGIAVAPQGNSGVFQQAGFRDGDIITGVNGRPIRSAADIETLRASLTPGARLSLTIERGAEVVPISLNLENP